MVNNAKTKKWLLGKVKMQNTGRKTRSKEEAKSVIIKPFIKASEGFNKKVSKMTGAL